MWSRLADSVYMWIGGSRIAGKAGRVDDVYMCGVGGCGRLAGELVRAGSLGPAARRLHVLVMASTAGGGEIGEDFDFRVRLPHAVLHSHVPAS